MLRMSLFLIIFAIISPPGAVELQQIDSLCGPRCLMAVCEYLGVHADFEEIKDLSGYNSKSGTTMLNLYKAAQKKKLPVVPLKTNLDEMCSLKAISIAYVDGNHFLVFHGCQGGKVIIQNPPLPSEAISKKDFLSRWKGQTLVFSKQLEKKLSSQIAEKKAIPSASQKIVSNKYLSALSPKAARIDFPDTLYDFGTVNEGVKLSKKFMFSNVGNDTLDISVRSTCSCTGALLTDKRVPPGGSGQIELTYDTRGRKGFTTQELLVRTNDPENKLQKLTISAVILSDVTVVPDKIWLGEVAKNEKISRKLLLYDSGNGKLRIKNIVTEPGIEAEVMPFQKDADGIKIIPIQLSIHSSKYLGNFNNTILIKTNDSKKPEIKLTISGKVAGATKVNPPVVYFGEVKPKSSKIYDVTLLPPKDRVVEFYTTNSLPNVKTDIIPMENNAKYKLSIKLQAPDYSTTLRDTLFIYIKGEKEPDQKIPLYAKIVF
ncbi:MAG: DUF1573 domain-containing protein [Candidatus Latescibacterota bacterium]